jgi:hypothetical protein
MHSGMSAGLSKLQMKHVIKYLKAYLLKTTKSYALNRNTS